MLIAGKEIDWDEIGRADNRQHAHHEAGHAVADFLFDNSYRISHICMESSEEIMGEVWRSRPKEITDLILRLKYTQSEMANEGERRAAYREILTLFAGPAAGDRVVDEPNGDWLSSLNEEIDESANDLPMARELAGIVWRTWGRQESIIRTVAKWADELMAIPRVWGTVTALAGKLGHGVTMSGEDACRIMREAWGDDDGLAIRSLGRKWTRRFMVQKTKGR